MSLALTLLVKMAWTWGLIVTSFEKEMHPFVTVGLVALSNACCPSSNCALQLFAFVFASTFRCGVTKPSCSWMCSGSRSVIERLALF